MVARKSFFTSGSGRSTERIVWLANELFGTDFGLRFGAVVPMEKFAGLDPFAPGDRTTAYSRPLGVAGIDFDGVKGYYVIDSAKSCVVLGAG